ncbi:ATP-binding protein [Streptomyces sp. NPDC019531]|uniref:ATP-binding protein n=1 Tax=Streptomyces sp. NPDC019531 TaxID=3365062 RepID=UPI00384CE217
MPPQPPHGIYDTTPCVEELRDALAVHGITLPSLRPAGVVVLGSCTAATARMLAAALRGDGRAVTPAGLDLRLLALPEAVPDLRRAVRRHLGASCGDIQLCVTELVTNVIRHVGEGTPVRVRVARVGRDRIRVEVTDPDARALPVLRRAAGDDESGRGLALLDAVALRWGVEQWAETKTVWCELRRA